MKMQVPNCGAFLKSSALKLPKKESFPAIFGVLILKTWRIIVEARNPVNELNQLTHLSTGFVTAGDADFFHLKSVQFLISEIKVVSKNQQLDFPLKQAVFFGFSLISLPTTSCFFVGLSLLRTGNVPCPSFPAVVINPPRAVGRAAFGFAWMGSKSPVQADPLTAGKPEKVMVVM